MTFESKVHFTFAYCNSSLAGDVQVLNAACSYTVFVHVILVTLRPIIQHGTASSTTETWKISFPVCTQTVSYCSANVKIL